MKIQFGSIVVDARGKLNGHVFKKTAFGNSISRLASPRNRFQWQTNPQLNRNALIMSAWNNLTDFDKNIYNVFATANPFPNAFGVLRNIGGRAMFVKLTQMLDFPGVSYPVIDSLTNISVPIGFSIEGVDGGNGFITIEVDSVPEQVGLAMWVQQVSNSRLVPPSNKWRRIPNLYIDGSGMFTTDFDIFSVIGKQKINHRYWIRILQFNSCGYGRTQEIVLLPVM